LLAQSLLPTAVALLFFWGSHRAARRSVNSYFTLTLILLGVVAVVTWAFLFGVIQSLPPFLLGLLGIAVILGSVTGSWPDAARRWPSLFRRDLAAAPSALPELVGAAGGLVAGVWAWSSLAALFGVIGVILGACALIVCCILGGVAPFVVSDIVIWWRERSPPDGGIGRGTS
jgi:hypothetical protein